jgi:formylglycine-generating enzyme required for sulfatase activity/serine/threonine protein kinase
VPAPDQDVPELPTIPPPVAAGASEQQTSPGQPEHTAGQGAQVPGRDARLTSFLAAPQADNELGRLGNYRILKILGQGGMGVVYHAEDLRLKRSVALKAMLPDVAGSESSRKRFLREAQAMAAVEHDHIVRIYQVDEERGIPFLAMEYLKGEPLDQRLVRERKLPVPEVLRVGREIAEALGAAHNTGLIHRDIKPANIWLEAPRDRVKLLDFGLAREITGDVQLTTQGVVLGTPAYMSPEQGSGDKVDARCDLFSLGVVLYRLCTGRLPFVGDDPVSTLMAILTQDPTPPADLGVEVPRGLSDLVMRLLEKDRTQRIGSAAAVVDALRALEQNPDRTERISDQAPPRPVDKAKPIPPPLPVTPRPADNAKSVPSVPRPAVAAASAGKRSGWWAAVVAIVAALALVAINVVLFWQPGNGTVHLEINDPSIKAALDKDAFTIEGVAPHNLALAPGAHVLRVKRGDLEFQTGKFVLGQDETVRLKIELLPDRIRVVQGAVVIGEKTLAPAASGVISASPTPPIKPTVKTLPPPTKATEKTPPTSTKTPVKTSPLLAKAPFNKEKAREFQQAWAKYLGRKVEESLNLGGGITMEFVLIPPGSFDMGAPMDEKPRFKGELQHHVTLTRPFYLGKYEVTQEQYQRLMGNNPSWFTPKGMGKREVQGVDTRRLPVETVSWDDATAFCDRLSKKTGRKAGLPSEAQWEYACRAGSTTAFHFGTQPSDTLGNFKWITAAGTTVKETSMGRPTRVGAYPGNAFGLYDMHGNVWEWCQDWFGPYAGLAAKDPQRTDKKVEDARIVRGGSWSTPPMTARSAHRIRNLPTHLGNNLGFRVALRVD